MKYLDFLFISSKIVLIIFTFVAVTLLAVVTHLNTNQTRLVLIFVH